MRGAPGSLSARRAEWLMKTRINWFLNEMKWYLGRMIHWESIFSFGLVVYLLFVYSCKNWLAMVIQTCMNINTIILPSSPRVRSPTERSASQVTISRALKSYSRSCELQNQDSKTRFNEGMKKRQKLLSLRHKKSRVHTCSSRLFQLFRWTEYLNQ